MKNRFDQDAARWEEGELTLIELEARHPDMDVRQLTQLWWHLAAFAETPTPDPEAGWGILRAQLPERLQRRERLRWRVRRSVVAAAAAAMLGGTSIAYAAGVEPVRHEVNQIVKGVTRLFGNTGHGNGDGTNPGPPGSNKAGTNPSGQRNGVPGPTNRDPDQSGSNQGGSNQDRQNGSPNQQNTGSPSSDESDQENTSPRQGNSGSDEGGDSNQGGQENSGPHPENRAPDQSSSLQGGDESSGPDQGHSND